MISKGDYANCTIPPEHAIEPDLFKEPSKRLWLSVLQLAICDIRKGHAYQRREACKWMSSEDIGIGSFLWICTNLGMPPDTVRCMSQRKLKVNILHPTSNDGKLPVESRIWQAVSNKSRMLGKSYPPHLPPEN